MSDTAVPLNDDVHPPIIKSSLHRSWSIMSTSTDSTDHGDPHFGVPAFVSIFQEAAKYGDVLSEEPDSLHSSGDDSETGSISDASSTHLDKPTPADESGATTPTTHEAAAPMGRGQIPVEHIDKLMSSLQLNQQLNNSTSRLVKLSVNAYSTPENGGDSLVGVPSTPDSGSESSVDLAKENDRVIPLLVKEFGPIAEEGEEERLVVESDGAYFQEVAILGIVHLTTHRITFHASLLSTRPDYFENSQVIKGGPVIIHRDGLRRKRRLWMELSHDMICTFPDSTDEGRVRPIRSILLSHVKEIKPLDPAEPKSLRLKFKSEWGTRDGHVEFDTVESAVSWRRELTSALHEHLQRRNALFRGDANAPPPGVRIAIPLHRVESFDSRAWGSFAQVVTFHLSQETQSPEAGSDSDLRVNVFEETYQETITKLREAQATSPDFNVNSITMTIIQGFNAEQLREEIVKAKARRVHTPSTLDNVDQVVVDFGELALMDPNDVSGMKEVPTGGIPAQTSAKDVEHYARRIFALAPEDEIWYARASIGKFNTSGGYLVVSAKYICLWTKGLVSDNQRRFHCKDITSANCPEDKRICQRKIFHHMILQVRGQKDMTISFKSNSVRDEAVQRINAMAKAAKERSSQSTMSPPATPTPGVSNPSLVSAKGLTTSPLSTASRLPSVKSPLEELASIESIQRRSESRHIPPELVAHLPRAINIDPKTQFHITTQHFVCLTIGSRGDVQPYIALCRGLKAEGHQVTIVTHEEYKVWVEGFGITHRTAGGDPGALMKLSVEHKMFSPQFFKESLGNFRKWLDDLLVDSYEQVKAAGATVLIESPSAMAGVHIAEALNIPYFRAFTMPWSRTAEYPHAFISPPDFVAGSFNYSTYVLFDNVFWRATAPQINPWRKKVLGLRSTDLEHLAQTKIPFLYNFSPHVVPKPLDWSDTTMVTGYWFLDNPDLGWTPSQPLLDFIAKAREEKRPLVYIGFGSIVVEDPKAMTKSIVKAVLKSDVRAILNKGWSARMSISDDTPEISLPLEVYEVDKIPHDWLFPQIDAALHHGGAGTTGASLRAGIPTLIKPWFGDQFFWASRVQKLGAGLRVPSLSSSDLAHALTKATTDRVIREKAQAVGEKIRQEDGVATAIRSLYTYLHRAGIRPAALERKSTKHHSKSAHSLDLEQLRTPPIGNGSGPAGAIPVSK